MTAEEVRLGGTYMALPSVRCRYLPGTVVKVDRIQEPVPESVSAMHSDENTWVYFMLVGRSRSGSLTMDQFTEQFVPCDAREVMTLEAYDE